MEGPIFEHEGALMQFHFGVPPSSIAPVGSNAANSKKRPREVDTSAAVAAPAASTAGLRATVVRWRPDSNSCTVQDVLVALPSPLIASGSGRCVSGSLGPGASFTLAPVASGTVMDHMLGFSSAFVLLRQITSIETSVSSTESMPSANPRLVLCSASVRTTSVTQAAKAKLANAGTNAPAPPSSRRIWRTEAELTTPVHLLEHYGKGAAVPKGVALTSTPASSSKSSSTASAASADMPNNLASETLLFVDEPIFGVGGSIASPTKWQIADGPMALGLSSKPPTIGRPNQARIGLLVFRRSSSSKWALEEIELPPRLFSLNALKRTATESPHAGTPTEDGLNDEDAGGDGEEEPWNFDLSLAVLHCYPQHEKHEIEVCDRSDEDGTGSIFWGSEVSDNIVPGKLGDTAAPVAPVLHPRQQQRRQRLLALLRVGGHLFDLIAVSETATGPNHHGCGDKSGVIERTALIPSGHLPFDASIAAPPNSSSSTAVIGSNGKNYSGKNVPSRSDDGATAAFVLDGDPRVVHVTCAGPSSSAESNGSTPAGSRLRSWRRVPGHPHPHEPLCSRNSWSGGVVLGSWPLSMCGSSDRSRCVEAISVASDNRGGCFALRFASNCNNGREDKGDELVVVARGWPSKGGSTSSKTAAAACVSFASPSLRKGSSSSAVGSILPGTTLRMNGVAACFAGRFLPNGRQQLWFLPPAKATSAKGTSASGVNDGQVEDAPLRLRSVVRRGALLDSGKLCLRGQWVPIASLSSGARDGVKTSAVPRVSLLESTASSEYRISANGNEASKTLELPAGAVSTLEAISNALMGQVGLVHGYFYFSF